MKKVITYGTYDLLHYGHIKLLERAKELGDYLIVGVTADDYDKSRGKINVQQSLSERIEAIRRINIADEILVEEYEGQKIDDIKKYCVDIFAIGSDWIGKFDYLNEYCDVIYLERTKGISSTELRTKERTLKLGIVGDTTIIDKYIDETTYVNGMEISALYSNDLRVKMTAGKKNWPLVNSYEELLENVDAVYIVSHPTERYDQIKKALLQGKHVLCESPITSKNSECIEMIELAEKNNLILMEAIKTAYAMAFRRLLLLAKTGKIGNIISVDAVCTSLNETDRIDNYGSYKRRNSMCAWGPTALLPIFKILGTEYVSKKIISCFEKSDNSFDLFSKIEFIYKNAVASIKIGKGVKSEGELIITGTKGYIYVPSPWWKTDYFEIRFENPAENKRYFYQLDGEGIRYELVEFVKLIENENLNFGISREISSKIAQIIEDFKNKKDVETIFMEE
ncbi:glycerol-3-phosphate cytidylyltransferase [Clostridium botulinum]|nr:glycerol-3-phosphate cytidylyltransferase [Clostridium botulinum]